MWLLLGQFVFLPSAIGNGERKLRYDYVADQIHRLQPRMGEEARYRLAQALRDTSSTCGISWQILLSLAFHESSLNPAAVNDRSKDHGLTQINEKTILTLRLDRHRLMKDERYALAAACRVLTENKQRYQNKFEFWLGMYRSGTAVWKESVRLSATRYDRMIRRTAARLGKETQVAVNDQRAVRKSH